MTGDTQFPLPGTIYVWVILHFDRWLITTVISSREEEWALGTIYAILGRSAEENEHIVRYLFAL